MFTIKFIPLSTPPGKLADVEIHFTSTPSSDALTSDRLLDGLKLIGFAVWERRGGAGRNVTFPARQYSVNGERRSFALLRPIMDAANQNRVKDAILAAFEAYEEDQAKAESIAAGERATGTE